MARLKVGDWVQALVEITEDGFNGESPWTHARRGAVGHVVSEVEDPDLANVFWERAGTVTICHRDDLTRLGGADVGRSQIADP